jgi:hypothetical protein
VRLAQKASRVFRAPKVPLANAAQLVMMEKKALEDIVEKLAPEV